jgi:DNA sulfur modification protein DndD
MRIKQIVITNYQNYYGQKIFDFVKGINVIHGANGHGKTKFFESIEWLFKNTESDSSLEGLISQKAVHEDIEQGSKVKVSVRLTVSQDNEIKTIEKYFIANKENGRINTTKSVLIGIREEESGERYQVDSPKILRDEIFDERIRRYSMFKGETDLKVFENKDALSTLIEMFSDTAHFKKYIPKSEYLTGRAERAVTEAGKKNAKEERKYAQLSEQILRYRKEIQEQTNEKKQYEENINKTNKTIGEYENIIDNAEAYQTLTLRIQKKEDEVSRLKGIVYESEKYTQDLFDKNRLLVNYQTIFEEFKHKTIRVSKTKRKLENEYQQKIGEKKAVENLKNGIIPLPIGAPTRSHMEEMLEAELCKVCNREAKKDSEAYGFMNNRLQEYIEAVESEIIEKKSLFKNTYINSLTKTSDNHDENIAEILEMEGHISDNFEFVEKIKKDINKKIEQINKEESERGKVIGGSKIDVGSAANILKDFRGLNSNMKDDQLKLDRIINILKSKKEELNTFENEKNNIDRENVAGYLRETYNLLKDILIITTETTETEFNNLVNNLEKQANIIFSAANEGAYTGTIKLYKTKYGNQNQVEFKVLDNFNNPFALNGAQEVLAHTSLLLSISQMVKNQADESYPLILDAPLSTFDRNKYPSFFNSFKENTEQCIILVKDFIEENENNKISIDKDYYLNDIVKDKSFWVKLDDDSNETQIETINSIVIEL